jgi:hypothetical protein
MTKLPEPLYADAESLRSQRVLSRTEAVAHILSHLEDADAYHVEAAFNTLCTLDISYDEESDLFHFESARKKEVEYRVSVAHPSQVERVSARLAANGYTVIAQAEPEGSLVKNIDAQYLPDEDRPVLLVSEREIIPDVPAEALNDLLS